MFETITLHDFAQPLAARAKSRKFCGPYKWRPAVPQSGRSFYMGKPLSCAENGSGFRLRLEYTTDHLRNDRNVPLAYWCDEDGSGDSLSPIVAQLPHGRGWLAGWTMGAGMISYLATDLIHDDPVDAARMAHEEARIAAEREREHAAAEAARLDDDEDTDGSE